MKLGDFEYFNLPKQGIHLYHLQTEKFKTNSIKVILPAAIDVMPAFNALLPFVLFRGTTSFPVTVEMVQHLEDLYGTDLSVDVRKMGEWQLMEFSMESVDGQYLPPGEDLLENVLLVLAELLFQPYMEDGAFKASYITGEKRTLIEEIKGLKNNKMEYAMERCFQEMCRGEPFAIYKYGDWQELSKITPEALSKYYRQFIQKVPMLFFYVGSASPDRVIAFLQATFPFRCPSPLSPLTSNYYPPKRCKVIVEEDKITQGRLIMGYRTEITRASVDYPKLLLTNAFLGGFPHSRLFRQVREERGLAYYIFSRLESTKGIMAISSGIDGQNLNETVDIIQNEVDNIKRGNVQVADLENTRRSMISQLRIAEDDSFDIIKLGLGGILNGKPCRNTELIDALEKVTKEDVIEMMQRVGQDTIFFLQPSMKEVS